MKHPSRSREKPPISVEQQVKLLEGLNTADPDLRQVVTLFFLSTGSHPAVLADPIRHDFKITPDYYSYCRPKSFTPITFRWSRMITQHTLWKVLRDNLGATIQYYGQLTADLGKEAEVPYRVGPNRLRHEMFCNLARLGYDPFTIKHRTGTSLNTIGRYYTVGLAESKILTPEEKAWLREVMDP